MKAKNLILLLVLASGGAFAFSRMFTQSQNEPWKESQLMEPADLAKILNGPAEKYPVIYSIGPSNDIKGTIETGPAEDKANLDKLKKALSKLDKKTNVVIYCGCCPFKNCPNIRPAFKLLNDMGFENAKLLNLSKNLKVNWIDKGYPVN